MAECRCDTCLNSRVIISENGYHSVCCLSDKEAVACVVDAIRALAIRLNIPQHINEIGGKEDDIPTLAQKALEDPCTGGNPRETSYEDFVELYRKAF